MFKSGIIAIEYLTYSYDNGRLFVIYCWNVFSTILFTQECLKRFGEAGDQFILTYREKDEKETEQAENEVTLTEELAQQFNGFCMEDCSVTVLPEVVPPKKKL